MRVFSMEGVSAFLPVAVGLLRDPVYRPAAFVVLFGIIGGVYLHEVGHAYVASWMGDPTPAEHGRRTLNPVPHFKSSPFNMIALPLITWFFYGGTWALAAGFCPVNPQRMRNPRVGNILTSLAGPGVMILIALFAAGILAIPSMEFINPRTNPDWLTYGIFLAGFANLILAVFNLLPIPPLDGSHVLTELAPSLKPSFSKFARSPYAPFLIFLGGSWLISRILPQLQDGYLGMIRFGYVILGGR